MKKNILAALIIITLAFIIYCKYDTIAADENQITLTAIKQIDLKTPEPSGLHFDDKTNTLWVVSDENSTIYNLTPDGKIIGKLKVNGKDLEGITIFNDSVLVTILERDRIIIFLDKKGNELNRINVDISGKPNKGLEGITYNSNKNCFYLVNEKEPGLLFEIDINGEIKSQKKLTFASDYSGLFYNKLDNSLWITSDEDKALFKCSIDGKVQQKYSIDIEQIEGVAFDVKNKLLYIISDPLEQLFIFEMP